MAYSAHHIDTRPIYDVALHAYRPVLAISYVLAGKEWPARPQTIGTKDELYNLFQTMHVGTNECIGLIAYDKLEQSVSLPWDQQQSGLEALVESFMHGMLHIGTIQGIRAFGGFPTPPEKPKPARG